MLTHLFNISVSLTLMPKEVNFGISASSLATGLVLPCAVASVEDKGYAMDTGITGINGAFLKKEDTDKSCRYLHTRLWQEKKHQHKH